MADITSVIDNLKDKSGTIVYPRTLTKATYDDSGNRLDNILSEEKVYSQNVAGTYNATCTYNGLINVYTLDLSDTSITTINNTFFTLRFIAPNDYSEGDAFLFNSSQYTPVDVSFTSGQVVLINLDSQTLKCYSLGGGGAKVASEISITTIPNLEATNVQGALEELQSDLTTVQNQLLNVGGVVVSDTAPDVTKTTVLWVDLGNNSILKYSDGTQWLPVGSVWK